MIKLYVHENRTYFEGDEDQLEVMFDCLRVQDKKNAYFKARFLLNKLAYFKSVGDKEERKEKIAEVYDSAKYIKFYERRSDSFGTGLLRRVKKHLKENEIKFKVIDKRKPLPEIPPIESFEFVGRVEKREEQIQMANAALEKGCGIIHAATNSGKTEIACGIISAWKRAVGRTPRVLFLVHRTGLVVQTAGRFKKRLALPVAIIKGGKYETKDITVATTQTASGLTKHSSEFRRFLEKCDILFIDEFHVNKAGQVASCVNKCYARMRFGLSGTIDRKNKKKLFHYTGFTGPIVGEISNRELISLGRSAKPIIRMVNVPGEMKDFDYATAYRRLIIKSPIRNNLVIREVLRHVSKDRQVLVTVARIAHGLLLKDMLERRDIDCEFLSGSTPQFVREKAIHRFEKRRVPVLIASPIFDVGMDIPSIDAWCNAAGGNGWELVLQRLGRALRKRPDKSKVFISDFVDSRNQYLLKHSLNRKKYYKQEGAKIKTVSWKEN